MFNHKIEVFGRIKPELENSEEKNFKINEGETEDVVKFTSAKYSSMKRTFRFKKIFCPDTSSQEDVFEYAAKPIIENVLTGYNGTIFAYGQTGTGKTYTMTGDFSMYSDRGIIPRTIQFLFHSIKENAIISISYFEIYNEHGYDLIGYEPTSNTVELQQVNVLEDSKGNLHFRNLSAHNVTSVQEALDLLIFGDGNRMVAETMNNLRSSRSHTIFLVTLEINHPGSDNTVRSTLHLVDLAGSERLGKAGGHNASNTWESRYINLSLHYLEQVLVALGEPGRIHIPYRNSLMTTVLKNSLGGNCCTAMIATFSTEPKDFEETLQTCRFAQRVALVRNEAKINEVSNIQKELVLLRRENAYLKEQLRELTKPKRGDEAGEELLEKDRNECLERVKDFIEDAKFMNLPLNHFRKAEYCFILMRDEIMKLKLDSKKSEISHKFENGPPILVTNPENALVAYRKMNPITFFDRIAGEDLFGRRRNDAVLRKRRVVMDLPKINVIYKKYRSTDAVPHKSETRHNLMPPTKLLEGDRSQTSVENSKKVKSDERISECCQTSATLLKVPESRTSCRSLVAASANNSRRMEEVTKPETKNPKEKLPEPFEAMKAPEIVTCGQVQVLDGVRFDVKNRPNDILEEEEEEEKKEKEGEKLGDRNDEDNLKTLDGEVLDQSKDSIPTSGNTVVPPVESDRTSRFSVAGLPLTGDVEIDEEIIKFYRARYQKFKTKD